MEFLDIRTLKAASLVNRDLKCGADRLIWQSFYICVHPAPSNGALHRVEEGCRIASTGIRAKRIRKFTLTFSQYQYAGHAADLGKSIMEMVFATLRLLTRLLQLELDLKRASWRGLHGPMWDPIWGPFPFQLEHFALTKPSCDEIEFLPEFLISQKSITSLFINWAYPLYMTTTSPRPRPRPLHVLDSGEWHLVENRPITHLFAALIDADEVFDLFGSLSQSTATLQLLWFRAPSSPASDAFFKFAADPIATTVVSNLRYLVLETFLGGDIRVLSLFSNLEELVMDLRPAWDQPDPNAIESGVFESSKSCPRLRKVVLFLYNRRTGFVIRFYRRLGAEEDWELMREDIHHTDIGNAGPLRRRRRRFPAMPY